MATYTFPKSERLYLQKDINELFALGKGVVAYPLRVIYLIREDEGNQSDNPRAKMLVSVSKRAFKRANKRNRVKRLVREAYRLNKHELFSQLECAQLSAYVGFLFVGKELPDYKAVDAAMHKAFRRLHNVISPLDDNL